MKKRNWRKFVVFPALLVTVAALVAYPVAAQEPLPDLADTVESGASLVLLPNVVWKIEGIKDLMIAPEPYDSSEVTIEMDTEKLQLEPNTDVAINGKRLMALKGQALLWVKEGGPYAIVGWAPKSGVPVVKTGPMASGLFGPPPPKTSPTPTPVPPTPTPVPPTPVPPTPVPPTPVPPTPEVKFALREDGHLLVTYDGGQKWEDLGVVRGKDGDQGPAGIEGIQGPPGTRPSTEEIFAGLNFEVRGDNLWLGEKDLGRIKGERGEKGETGSAGIAVEGPPGPGVSDTLVRAVLISAVLAITGTILGAWGVIYARSLPEWVRTLVKVEAANASGARGEILNRLDQESGRTDELSQKVSRLVVQTDEARRDRTQLEQALFERIEDIEAEIAPLRPQVAAESNGRLRCPGCNGFVVRIAQGLAGHCKRCGVSYTMPVPEPVETEVVTEEVAD